MTTVFDKARSWAKRNFKGLEGQPYDAEFLTGECQRLLQEFPGIEQKKWLFIYSPYSAGSFFEVGKEFPRLMVALAKLGTIASEGGMLLGADFSEIVGNSPVCREVYSLVGLQTDERRKADDRN